MSTEHDLKRKCDTFFQKLKLSGARIYFTKIHGGGPFQRVGLPDYLLCLNGQFVGLELKKPGEDFEPGLKQRRELEWIELAGGLAWVCDDLEDVKAKVMGCLEA